MTTTTPRVRCLVNGSDVTQRAPDGSLRVGLVSATVTTTNYARGDSFDAQVAYPNTGAPPSWADPAAGTTQVEVTLQASLDGTSWTTLIVGLVDHVAVDPIVGTVNVTGRDYSSLLIDLQVQEGWLNRTSGEVVAQLAQKAGLTANVAAQGSLTGQFYQIGHKRSALAAGHRFTTGWEVVRYLASVEGCDVWVSGKTLNYQPALSDTSPAYSLALDRGQNGVPISRAMTVRLERDLLMAKGVVVLVVSWESKARRAHKSYWSAKGGSSTGASAATTTGTLYTYKFPGLNADAAERKAKELYDQIVAHQRTVTLDMPLDLSLTPRQRVQIAGTGTSFDGLQRIDSIEREIGWDTTRQSVTLRNRDVTEQAGQ